MGIFERRQRILKLLNEQAGVRVGELAESLNASQATIRHDLRALEEAGQLRRMRGGALPRNGGSYVSEAFAARVRLNAEAKQAIARRAAEMVADGDSILLDASTTVFALARYLQARRNLTIITNGIQVGLALAQNPSHTVILVGGALRPDGTSVVGHLGRKILGDLHVKTAFVSCSGLSIEAGLTEVDIHEVDLKKAMLRCAGRVVALIDSSKFGRVELTLFAGLDQVSHIFADKSPSPLFQERLRQTHTELTVCGEGDVPPGAPSHEATPPQQCQPGMQNGAVSQLSGTSGSPQWS